jgi:fructokinase
MNVGLVIGESLIDIVEQSQHGASEHVGGSPLNVAVGLARLGRDIDFLTRIGEDSYGRQITGYVESAGVRLVPGSRVPGRTATARLVVQANGSADYEFDLDWRLSEISVATPPVVVHTGSIASVQEPGCLAVAAAVESYRGCATVSFDPNVRPTLIADRDFARARIEELVERSDVVKVSEEDLHWFDPDHSPGQIAQTWLASGPAIVAVTMAERGAVAFCAAGSARVAARPVRVVDTVGAGDAFAVGLIDALWSAGLLGADRRAELAELELDALTAALDAGRAAAAVTVERAGADLPDRAALTSAQIGTQ